MINLNDARLYRLKSIKSLNLCSKKKRKPVQMYFTDEIYFQYTIPHLDMI